MREIGKITLRKSISTSLLINSHSNLTIMGFISDGIVSHESHLGGYEFHLGCYEFHLRCYEFHLGCYEFLEVWCLLKIRLDQTGPIREGLGDSHVTVGRHVRDITDREKLIRMIPNQKAILTLQAVKFETGQNLP